jgi:hypothetical protein
MVALNAPSSTAVVDVPEELVESYVAQGWTRQDEAEPKRKPGRPKKSE